MRLDIAHGLPFAKIELWNNDKNIKLNKALIDTGSATTIISVEAAINLGLGPQPNDEINLVRGVGGSEAVYERTLEKIALDSVILTDCKVDIGAMEYGFRIDAIIGVNILKQAKAVINLSEMTIIASN